ncbi:MAG: hypothetical protein ACO3E4_05635 [Candidatus Nanopelagicaceae bacterium]
MTYSPNAIVTIGATNYTDKTINGVSISFGRSQIWEQARASVATVSLVSPNGTAIAVDIDSTLTVSIEDSVGDPVTIFTGKVSQVNNSIAANGEVGVLTVTTIQAYGPFAQMSRTVINATAFPKEYDDDRMDRILTAAGVTIDIVDTPGVYELTAKDNGRTDAYSLAAQYAQMVSGYIYETTDYKVGYANEARRLNDIQDNGYTNLDLDAILSAGLQSSRTRSNIINSLTLKYKNDQSVSASDASSISLYGVSASTLTTELEQTVEAQALANRYINLLSLPETSLGAISIQLANPNVSSVQLDALIAMRLGFPISLTGLPDAIYEDGYVGFVEGWNWTINRWSAQLNLTTTEATLSIAPTRWQDVDPATAWEDVDVAVQWYEYE